MAKSIEVSIIEADAMARKALVAIVSGTPGFCCMSEHPNPVHALESGSAARSDVAVVGICRFGAAGLEAMRQWRRKHPSLKWVALGRFERTEEAFDTLKAGADACVLRSDSPASVLEAIEWVQRGSSWLSPLIAHQIVEFFHKMPDTNKPMGDGLTPRELEILGLAKHGLGHKQIASKLGLSYDTVRTHFRNLYQKLGASSRSEAVARYYRL